MNHHRNEVFITYRIKNRSRISFEIGDLALFKVQGKKARRSSFQKILLKPIYKDNVPNIILKGEMYQFTVVYSKFSLGRYQELRLEINEEKGSRFFELAF